MTDPGTVTLLLRRWKIDGSREAEDELFQLVSGELRQVASRALASQSGMYHKVDPRELVSEAYLRLREYAIHTDNRGPFFALMARAMREYLLDLARRGKAGKRPSSQLRVVDTGVLSNVATSSEVGAIEFYSALDALQALAPRQARAIDLRLVGLSNQEIARELDISAATLKRDVAHARAFLAFHLGLSPERLSS